MPTGTSAVGVSTELKALLPNTTYHFRLVAGNSAGSTPSEDKEFTTPKIEPAAPVAEAIEPIETPTGYKLQGNINPNGLKTGYHFEFGTTTGYGTNIPEANVNIGEGEATVPVFQEVRLNELTPNTTYHYRIVAENSEGPGMSKDETFTTKPEPPAVARHPFHQDRGGLRHKRHSQSPRSRNDLPLRIRHDHRLRDQFPHTRSGCRERQRTGRCLGSGWGISAGDPLPLSPRRKQQRRHDYQRRPGIHDPGRSPCDAPGASTHAPTATFVTDEQVQRRPGDGEGHHRGASDQRSRPRHDLGLGQGPEASNRGCHWRRVDQPEAEADRRRRQDPEEGQGPQAEAEDRRSPSSPPAAAQPPRARA